MLEIARLCVLFFGRQARVTASVRATARVEEGEAIVEFASPVRLGPGESLELALG